MRCISELSGACVSALSELPALPALAFAVVGVI
jgi:hypothetical protein